MRFTTTVALSTLALAAMATAVPVAGDYSSEGTGRGSCHRHGKSQHKKMTSTKCQNIKGATVVGYKADGNCYDKSMLSHFATLHPSFSGTCYYVPSKSGSSLGDPNECSVLEARGTKTKLLLGAVGAGLLWHAFKPKHKENHEEQSQSTPSYESREFYDYEDLNARDFENFDYLYGRDLDVLEGRSVGKVLLGATIGGIAAHEWGKHKKKKEEESED